MKRSPLKKTIQGLALSILGAVFVVNLYVVHENDLWWQWVFGLVLSFAGGLLVAIAIASLLRRPAATDEEEEEEKVDPSRTPPDRDGGPDEQRPSASSIARHVIQPEDAISSLPGIGPENARVARTFGVSTLADFVGLDAAAQEDLRKALGSSLFERVSVIAARVSQAAGK